jgi:hypothetical protein
MMKANGFWDSSKKAKCLGCLGSLILRMSKLVQRDNRQLPKREKYKQPTTWYFIIKFFTTKDKEFQSGKETKEITNNVQICLTMVFWAQTL